MVVHFVHCNLSTLLSFWWSSFWWSCFWWPCFWWHHFQERFSSGAFYLDSFSFNRNFFALWLVQTEPPWIRLWLWSCTLEQMFSVSNWQFLISCYHQNLEGDFAKHPLFQQSWHWPTLVLRWPSSSLIFICGITVTSNLKSLTTLGEMKFSVILPIFHIESIVDIGGTPLLYILINLMKYNRWCFG